MDQLDESARYGAFSFDHYIADHWPDDTPEESHQQWERLVWAYQRLTLIERYTYSRRADQVVCSGEPSGLSERHIQILRTHQTVEERNFTADRQSGIQTVWLRTCYDKDLAEKYEDMFRWAEIAGDQYLDDSARYAFDDGRADHWRQVLLCMPGITDSQGITDNEGDGSILEYNSGLNDPEMRAQAENLENEGLRTLALKELEFQAVLYLVDREALQTGLVKMIWLDEHGVNAWENVLDPRDTCSFMGALMGATRLDEFSGGLDGRGSLICC